MTKNRIALGNFSEQLASEYLIHNGYKLIQVNFRTRFGQIDIIAKDADILCFIEVKARKGKKNASQLAYESITPIKQNRIKQMSLKYLAKHNLYNINVRFDAVFVLYNNGCTPNIQLLKDAFE